MALKVVWTLNALNGFNKVIKYLEENWTKKEILNLEIKLKKLIFRISKHPKIYPSISKTKSLSKALIDKIII